MSTEKITLAKSTSVRNYKKNQIKRKWVIHRKRKQIKYGMYIWRWIHCIKVSQYKNQLVVLSKIITVHFYNIWWKRILKQDGRCC